MCVQHGGRFRWVHDGFVQFYMPHGIKQLAVWQDNFNATKF